MIYELIGRLTVWFVKRRAIDRVSSPSLATVLAVAVAGGLVGLLGIGLLLGGAEQEEEAP